MEQFNYESVFSVSPEKLFDWHARPGAFGRLLPPWQRAELGQSAASLADGTRVEFRLRKGPFSFRWLAEHRDVEQGRRFTDVQIKGPFRHWTHVHEFVPHNSSSGSLLDRIEYRLPGGALGRLVAGSSICADLERTFRYRHRVLGQDLTLHEAFADRPRLRVAITGASGLIGTALKDLLTTGGHEVVSLSRTPSRDDEVEWDPSRGALDLEAIRGVDAVVHLAGENVAGRRWTGGQMERIRSSRIAGTRWLINTLKKMPEPPGVFLSASAIGLYGDRGEERLTEASAPGSGFLAEVSTAWEAEAMAARQVGMRTALARFGIVLSPRGGALAKMLTPFRLGAGGRLGSGKQMMSWISIEDAAAALLHLLMDATLEGPFNLSAPRPVSNQEFTRTLARVLKRPAIAPVPALAARLAFGRMADEMLLSSALVLPERLEDSGFVFRQPTLEVALRQLLGRE